MTARTLGMLARAVGGELVGGDARFASVSTDSRSIEHDQLFVAIKGPNFDGHEFVAAAQSAGAAGAMVSRRAAVVLPQVVVEDTRRALGAYAHAWRMQFGYPVVGLTGSNGKTTTKEMIAAILARRGPVLATRGNLNNDIGVPLTLLRMEANHVAAVIEMGANHAGEIAALAALSEPTVALVTNAGPAHLEGFGSIEGVARAKGELYQGLGRDARAVINLDDAWSGLWREFAGEREVTTFAVDKPADFRVVPESVHATMDGGQAFTLESPGGDHEIVLPVPGMHNVRNALAAIAAAVTAGAAVTEAVAALAAFQPVAGRLVTHRLAGGGTLVDDTYNANPASAAAAIDVLAMQPGTRWLVLGDMGELGAGTRELHAAVGAHAHAAGIERLFTLGDLARAAADAFGEHATHCDDLDSLLAALGTSVPHDTTVLVKGSRSMRMERVVAALGAARGA